MASKKQLEKKVQSVVSKLCTPVESGLYNYAVGTKLGILWVNPHGEWIACRFEDVEMAREVYRCNPYSGKYNFHSDECVEEFSDLIEDLENQGRLLDAVGLEGQIATYRAKIKDAYALQ